MVVDFPNSAKAKKFYLCLYCGPQPVANPKALGVDEAVAGIDFTDRKRFFNFYLFICLFVCLFVCLFISSFFIYLLIVCEYFLNMNFLRDKRRKGKKKDKNAVKSKDWVLAKKDRQKRQGKEVRPDSKYTARSRRRFL